MKKNKMLDSYEVMKDNIIYRLVNSKKNQGMQQELYDELLDMAVTYHCLFESNGNQIKTVQITKDHLKQWNVGKEIVRVDAFRNTSVLFPVNICSMRTLMKDAVIEEQGSVECPELPKSGAPALNEREVKNGMDLYVLSNLQGINGASCLLYPNILEEFYHRIGRDFYILPSSIHELILAPVRKYFIKEELDFMVQEINVSQVAPQEVLSEHAYLYSVIKEELESFFNHRQ